MTDQVIHAGIKGMRWGVRKKSEDAAAAGGLKKKGLKSMTNKELETYLKRADLEKRYREHNPSKTKKAKERVKKLLGKKVEEILDTAIKIALEKAIAAAFAASFKGKPGGNPNVRIIDASFLPSGED